MDNKLYNIDDALIVTIEPKIIGKVIFTSFIENIVGVTSNRYLDKNFTCASELFNRALSFKPNDKAATQMLERIEALKSSPNLDSSWDGSISLMSK